MLQGTSVELSGSLRGSQGGFFERFQGVAKGFEGFSMHFGRIQGVSVVLRKSERVKVVSRGFRGFQELLYSLRVVYVTREAY